MLNREQYHDRIPVRFALITWFQLQYKLYHNLQDLLRRSSFICGGSFDTYRRSFDTISTPTLTINSSYLRHRHVSITLAARDKGHVRSEDGPVIFNMIFKEIPLVSDNFRVDMYLDLGSFLFLLHGVPKGIIDMEIQ